MMSINYPLQPVQMHEFPKGQGKRVLHGFFTRQGGVSQGLYRGLNCGLGSDDDQKNVAQNIALVKKSFASHTLHIPIQTHSNICKVISGEDNDIERQEADALVTKDAFVILGILTADCAPVLLSGITEDKKIVVGAAHAGWQGAFGGILDKTVECMIAQGAVVESINATVGPAIQQRSYQVGRDFYEQFIFDDPDNDHFFKLHQYNDLYFDLPGYVAARLKRCGVSRVLISDHDTYARKDDYYSYRRATHNAECDYGRQISCIMIKN